MTQSHQEGLGKHRFRLSALVSDCEVSSNNLHFCHVSYDVGETGDHPLRTTVRGLCQGFDLGVISIKNEMEKGPKTKFENTVDCKFHEDVIYI